MKTNESKQTRIDRLERGEWLSAMLAQARPRTAEYEALLRSYGEWLDQDLPTLLAIVRDTQAPLKIRGAAGTVVLSLLRQPSPLAQAVSGFSSEMIEAFTLLRTERDQGIQALATAVLAGLDAVD